MFFQSWNFSTGLLLCSLISSTLTANVPNPSQSLATMSSQLPTIPSASQLPTKPSSQLPTKPTSQSPTKPTSQSSTKPTSQLSSKGANITSWSKSSAKAFTTITLKDGGKIEFEFRNTVPTEVYIQYRGLEKHQMYPYHIHQNAISIKGDCHSAGFHWNPTNSKLGSKCNQLLAAQCESGDLSGKQGPLIGYGTQVKHIKYRDASLEWNSGFLGKSIVIHDPKDHTKRIGCATIKKLQAVQ